MEKSSFTEIYSRTHKTVLKHTMDVMTKKKSMKLNMGLHFEIYRKLVYDNDGRPVIGATSRIENIIDEFGDRIQAEIKPTAKLYSTKTLSVNPTNLSQTLENKADQLDELAKHLPEKGSEWRIYKVLFIYVKCFTNKPQRGSSWIPTPDRYNNARCGLINIKNEDLECFKWCVKYHQTSKEKKRR